MTMRVALIGCGYFSKFHREAWGRMDDVVLLGLADQDPARLAAAAAPFPQARTFASAEAMLDAVQPDLVDIVTPPASHHALVGAAAARGIPAICQKPLAPSYSEAVALVETAEAAGVLLVVHENFRFMPWFAEVTRLVAAGQVGRPLNIAFSLRPGDGQGPRAYLDRQPYFQTMERFLVHETGIHLIDVFRLMLGEITGVFARLRRLNPVIVGEDAGLVVVDFASGAAGLLDGNRLVDHPCDDTRLTNGVMLVEGTEGVIRLDGYGRVFVRAHRGIEREHDYAIPTAGFGGDCVFAQCRHVVDSIQACQMPVNTGRDYLRNLAVEEAIYQSAAEERFIRV